MISKSDFLGKISGFLGKISGFLRCAFLLSDAWKWPQIAPFFKNFLGVEPPQTLLEVLAFGSRRVRLRRTRTALSVDGGGLVDQQNILAEKAGGM